MVAIGIASGVKTEALITRMDAPLGRAVGNANEVIESIETLKGKGPADLEHLSVQLAARMLVLSGVSPDATAAEHRVREVLRSGAGVEKFRQVIENQGGDPRVVDDYGRMPSVSDVHTVTAPRDGYVGDLQAERIGRAAVALGAGRAKLDDVVDPAVGIDVERPVGSPVRLDVALDQRRFGNQADGIAKVEADLQTTAR